jgi:DNA-binding response OmpR family regulator
MATILLVEDNEDVQESIKLFAERRGHDLFVAGDGNEGLKLYDTVKPDIVLMDIMMPDKDGIETSKELMQAHPEAVIFGYSGAALAADYFKLLEQYGVKRCFTKPLPMKELEAAINEELSVGST